MENGKKGGYVASIFPTYEDLQQTVETQKAEIERLRPKAKAYDELMQSGSLFPTNVVAKSFGMSAVALNMYLHKKKVQYKQGKVWVLYKKYANCGYTSIMWYAYAKDEKGRDLTKAHSYWTMKGIEFIRGLLKADGLLND